MRTLLIATVKNEGLVLLEWVAWHRLIGFDDIVIAQNDSDDMTKEMLICLEEIGAVHFVENSDPGDFKIQSNHQGRGYIRISNLPIYAASDWAMTLDGDEFLSISTGDGTVADLIEKLGDDADQIHVHWHNIRSGGFTTYEDELVTTRFTQTFGEGHITRVPNLFKTLYRTNAFERACVHRPQPPNLDPDRAVSASGVRIPREEMAPSGSKDPGDGKYARIFHYRIRDAESFVLAKTRGRPGEHSGVSETLGYWLQSDSRARTDDTMARQRDRILAEIAHLDALSGGQLMALYRKSVALSRERIAAFKEDPVLAAFYEDVCRLQSRIRGPQEREALIELYEMGEISWHPK